MRILQVIATLSAGGAESVASELAREQALLDHSVRLFLLAGVRGTRGEYLLKRLRGAEVRVDGIRDRKPRSVGNVLQFAWILNGWEPDIVHCHLYSAEVACCVARMFAVPSNVRYVRTLHSSNIVGSRSRRITGWMNHAFHATVACGPAVESAYRAFCVAGVRRQFRMIPNGGQLSAAVASPHERRCAESCFRVP